MPKKQTLIAILLSVAVMGAWMGIREYYQTYHPEYFVETPPPAAPATAPATVPAVLLGPASSQAVAVAPGTTAVVPGAATTQAVAVAPDTTPPIVTSGTTRSVDPATKPLLGLSVAPVAKEDMKAVELGSAVIDDPKFVMQLRTPSIGGAIEGITLNPYRKGEDFKKEPKDRGIFVFQQPYPNTHETDYTYTRPMATRSITIDGVFQDLSNAEWALKSQGENERTLLAPGQPDGKAKVKGPSVTYTTTILRNGQPALELTKTFTIFEKSSITGGFEVAVDFAMRNLTAGELSVKSTINGPTLPPPEAARPPDRNVMAGYRLKDGSINYPTPHSVAEFKEGVRTIDLTKDKDGNPVAWAGCASVYFNAFVLFEQPSQIALVAAEAKNITEPDAEKRPILMTFETTATKLAAGESHAMGMSAFFGPRWRDLLASDNNEFYAGATRDYDKTLVVKSGPCGDCAFDWLILGLVKLLGAFHWVAGGFISFDKGDWGIAIILLVALVRTLLHPITKKSQMQLMKMGKMGPEMAKLKEKYGDDKEAFAKAQMTLMKEQGLGPLLGCLPMFLQMPIWIALWQALQSTFELRQAPFLWHATWIEDLSKPDYLLQFSPINLPFGMVLDGLNLLPLLLSVVFHVQARIQNSLSVSTTPEQEQQKKMMMWMSTLLFPLFLYNGPSGLNLYILTSTFVGMIESKVIRNHIKQKEEAEKLLAPVVVDAKPTRAARKAQDNKVEEPAAPRTGIAGFFQRLQARVEEAQKAAEKQKKTKPK